LTSHHSWTLSGVEACCTQFLELAPDSDSRVLEVSFKLFKAVIALDHYSTAIKAATVALSKSSYLEDRLECLEVLDKAYCNLRTTDDGEYKAEEHQMIINQRATLERAEAERLRVEQERIRAENERIRLERERQEALIRLQQERDSYAKRVAAHLRQMCSEDHLMTLSSLGSTPHLKKNSSSSVLVVVAHGRALTLIVILGRSVRAVTCVCILTSNDLLKFLRK